MVRHINDINDIWSRFQARQPFFYEKLKSIRQKGVIENIQKMFKNMIFIDFWIEFYYHLREYSIKFHVKIILMVILW